MVMVPSGRNGLPFRRGPRFRALSLAASLVGAVMLTGITGTHVTLAAFANTCDGSGANYKQVVARASRTDYTGVIGDAVVRNLLPCTQSGANADDPAVLPANLQSSSGIVQVGWFKCQIAGGCGNVPADGMNHFVYICNDLSGGTPCDANGWAGAPTLGTRYRFGVYWRSSQWVYFIKNLSTGVQKSTTITAHWRYGNTTWWGAEVKNQQSAMGPAWFDSSDNLLHMYWMQYYADGIGSWSVTTNDLVQTQGVIPWYWAAVIGNQNYTGDRLEVWTENH